MSDYENWMKINFATVKLEFFGADKNKPIGNSSGVLVRDGDKVWLYTCWHSVSGYKPFGSVPSKLKPRRTEVRVSALKALSDVSSGQFLQTGLKFGGSWSTNVKLWQDESPAWQQTSDTEDDHQLNGVGLSVSKDLDVVRIEMDADKFATRYCIPSSEAKRGTIFPSDGVFISGYPWGVSSGGLSSQFSQNWVVPTILSRNPANIPISGSNPLLLDRGCFKGMSGGPIFSLDQGQWKLYGIYTGTRKLREASSLPSRQSQDADVQSATIEIGAYSSFGLAEKNLNESK